MLLQPPTNDFAFLSYPKKALVQELGDSANSSIENVFKDKDAWTKDVPVGSLTLKIEKTGDPRYAQLTADFTLDKGDGDFVRLEGKGELSKPGDLASLSRGTLVETVGTGKFAGRNRVIWLRVHNPKRWGFDDVPFPE